MRNVAEIGLNVLLTLLQKFAGSSVAGAGFFQTYFCDLMQHIFSVVTDTSHTSSELLVLVMKCVYALYGCECLCVCESGRVRDRKRRTDWQREEEGGEGEGEGERDGERKGERENDREREIHTHVTSYSWCRFDDACHHSGLHVHAS